MTLEQLAQLVNVIVPPAIGEPPAAGEQDRGDHRGQVAVSESIAEVIGDRSRLPEAMTSLASQIELLRNAQQSQVDAVADYTKAIAEGLSSQRLQDAAASARNSLGLSGISAVSPIISGLLRLFGRGPDDPAIPAAPVARPEQVRYERTLYGEDSRPASQGTGPLQVTVNVQTIDSRSFAEHSSDVAMALRRALLESNVIHDVLSEL